jgi:hypothetical protein
LKKNNKKERIIKMAEKVVIKIKKVNGENVIKIKGNPESKYHINLMAQKLRLGEIKPTRRLKIKRFFKKLNRVINQLADEICNQPKAEKIKPPMMAEQIQPRIYLEFKE